MAKIAAMLTVLLSGTWIGIRMADRLKCRLLTLKRIDAYFRRLMTGMAYARSPLTELACRAADGGNDPLFRAFGEGLLNGASPSGAWRDAMRRAAREDGGISCLTARDTKLLEGFVATLGTSDLRSQKEYACLLFAELTDAISEAERNYTGKARIYRSLGALGGVAVAILLL